MVGHEREGLHWIQQRLIVTSTQLVTTVRRDSLPTVQLHQNRTSLSELNFFIHST